MKPMPYGANRRPLSNTSVRCEPSPRSDTAEMPPVVEPATDAATRPLRLVAALTVCRSCSTVDAPVLWMSSRVKTCTGKAPSAAMRLIDDPVTSTRSSSCWAPAGETVTPSAPATASIKLVRVPDLLNVGAPANQ